MSSSKAFAHFKADFIEHVDDLLVVSLTGFRFLLQTLLNPFQLICKVLHLIHLAESVQSVDNLGLYLVPLLLVRLQEQLHLADQGLLGLVRLCACYELACFHIPQQ